MPTVSNKNLPRNPDNWPKRQFGPIRGLSLVYPKLVVTDEQAQIDAYMGYPEVQQDVVDSGEHNAWAPARTKQLHDWT